MIISDDVGAIPALTIFVRIHRPRYELAACQILIFLVHPYDGSGNRITKTGIFDRRSTRRAVLPIMASLNVP